LNHVSTDRAPWLGRAIACGILTSLLISCGGGGANNESPQATPTAVPNTSPTWHVAEQVNSATPDDLLLSIGSAVASNATGAPLAIWEQSAGIMSIELSSTGAWRSSQLIAGSSSGHQPKLAMDSGGNAMSIWSESGSIWSSRYVPGMGWSRPIRVSDNTALGGLYPRIAFDKSGTAVAVWQQGDGYRTNIWSSRFHEGTGWGTPQLIETNDEGSAQGVELAVASTGDAIAVWRQADATGADHIWANHFKPGAGWGVAEKIESNSDIASSPQISFLSPGQAMAVWSQGVHIWASQFSVDQGWSTALTVTPVDADFSYSPKVASDGKGFALVSWIQRSPLTNTGPCLKLASVGGSGGCSSPTATVTKVWSRSYSSGWGIAAPIGNNNGKSVTDQQLSFDGQGNAVAVWAQSSGQRTSIWASRFTIATGWDTASQLQNSTTDDASSPSLAVSENGSATVIWSQSNGKVAATVWAARLH
jgi:hypothetical protein